VVAIAVVLAALAAGAVMLYTNGVKEEARSGGELTTVIVATQDIPASTDLDPLLQSGAFKELQVPTDAVVTGAVASLDELRHQTTTAPIVANEQISTARLSSGEGVQGGALGISKDHVAVTVQLEGPEGGYGNIQRGDSVTVYATFQGVSILPGNLQQIIHGQLPPAGASKVELPDFTVTLVPTVKVLDIKNPTVDDATGKIQETDVKVVVTLDLTKEDAQNLVLAQETGLVWLGLLPPNEEGIQLPGSQIPVELLLGKKAAA
jgi:Flp pilus assembly protein CpaB